MSKYTEELIELAIILFKKNYDNCKDLKYVNKPVANALYQTWKQIDGKEKSRHE